MNETQTLETLKSLRLSAMAEVYEAFLRLGPSDSRTTSELIAEMAEAEWNAKWNRKTERLLKKAQLRIPASLDEIDYSPERNLDKGVVQSLARMEWVKNGSTVLITGATGVGKSFLACALGTEACLQGYSTRYFGAPKIFRKLRMARGDGTYTEEVKRLAKTSLLIIDDFGLMPLEHDDRLALLELLEDRYRKAATIIAAQIPISSWHQTIAEPTIADAVMDRLAHTPYIFELKGGSRRRKDPSD